MEQTQQQTLSSLQQSTTTLTRSKLELMTSTR